MDYNVFLFLGIALLCGCVGGYFSRKAKKSEKLSDLIVSAILAVLCLVFIIISTVLIVKSKIG